MRWERGGDNNRESRSFFIDYNFRLIECWGRRRCKECSKRTISNKTTILWCCGSRKRLNSSIGSSRANIVPSMHSSVMPRLQRSTKWKSRSSILMMKTSGFCWWLRNWRVRSGRICYRLRRPVPAPIRCKKDVRYSRKSRSKTRSTKCWRRTSNSRRN